MSSSAAKNVRPSLVTKFDGGNPAVLWDCLYLQSDELAKLLAFVEANAAPPTL